MLAFLRSSIAAVNSNKEEGATAVEYGLMVALIAAVIIAAVFYLGGSVKKNFCQVGNSVAAQSTSTSTDCPTAGQ